MVSAHHGSMYSIVHRPSAIEIDEVSVVCFQNLSRVVTVFFIAGYHSYPEMTANTSGS